MPLFDKIAISTKTNYFGTFCLFSFESIDLLHYPSNIQKDSSKMKGLNILSSSQLQAQHLVIPPKKRSGNKDDSDKSFTTYWCRATYHLNAETIFVAVE